MEGISTVHSAVHRASSVSKRAGKWANLQEIKRKTPSTFRQPVRPFLNKLVRNSDIEKKGRVSLWRPDDAGAAGTGRGKVNRRPIHRRPIPRRSSPKTDDRRSSPKTGGRSVRKTSGKIARTIARGAVGGAVSGSISGSVRNTVSRIMW